MTIMRRCEGCKEPIAQRQFLEVTLRVLRSEEDQNQDAVEQAYGDYCDECVATGKAVNDLVNDLKYTGARLMRAAQNLTAGRRKRT